MKRQRLYGTALMIVSLIYTGLAVKGGEDMTAALILLPLALILIQSKQQIV